MLKTKISKLLLASTLIISFGIASAAYATLFSSPGLDCVDGQGYIRYSGVAYNSHATSDTVFYCPLVRYGLTTTDISQLFAYVFDGNDAESIQCFVRSCEPDGSPCANSSTDSTGAAFTGNDTLSLGSVGGFTNGMAFLQCSVPNVDVSSSGVVSYTWND